ncbi:Pol polyprotein [Plakobranchus ocellatus]|uniref:Pol polyprotein n=1 Tax=Plakobranchus ocellatus TaxID=259542 RepID=A0AAV3ZJ45_9GAST|nr:Pol polyprotein [Plakobranchus ocellatus]
MASQINTGDDKIGAPENNLPVIPNKRKKVPATKDASPESFWASFQDITAVTKVKASNPRWGPSKIERNLKSLRHSITISQRMIKKYTALYFYDQETNGVYFRSTCPTSKHRRCLTKAEVILKIRENHASDHRKSDAIYASLRSDFYPIVRDNIKLLFNQHLHCIECVQTTGPPTGVPWTFPTRKPIPASYPNSRWQMDLKKMPPCNGYNYILNIVDCYSRFAFGAPIKEKRAKEIADATLHFIHLYGPPRILQTDNGIEFNNDDLAQVVADFKVRKMYGRPYHPQSQGRVESFNQTVVNFLKKTIDNEKGWAEQLQHFYYCYNNRVNKATRPSTPYEKFFGRQNISTTTAEMVAPANLTQEERNFLNSAQVDVDDEKNTEDTHSDLDDSHGSEPKFTPTQSVSQDASQDDTSTAMVNQNGQSPQNADSSNSSGSAVQLQTDSQRLSDIKPIIAVTPKKEPQSPEHRPILTLGEGSDSETKVYQNFHTEVYDMDYSSFHLKEPYKQAKEHEESEQDSTQSDSRCEEEENHFVLTGKYISSKLSTLQRDQRIHAEKLIFDVLYEAELRTLSRQSRLLVEPEQYQHQLQGNIRGFP